MLPWAIAHHVSANIVSVAGLALGTVAALSYARYAAWPFVVLGLVLSIGWLIADGLDGMIARATGTASPLGRMLDGLCDHGVFILIYVALALHLGTVEGWVLAWLAGGAHALQSSLYEGERARFHRRIRGEALIVEARTGGNPLVRFYDWFAGSPDRLARGFEQQLAVATDPVALGRRYGDAAAQPMRLLSLESANMRVFAIFLACLAGDPRLFWWFEILPLTLVAIAGLAWHRRVEQSLLQLNPAPADAPARYLVKEQGQ